MRARDQLLTEAEGVLVRQLGREVALSTRATGLLSAAAIVAAVAVGLVPDANKGSLPWWLIAVYLLLLAAAVVAIGGRQLLEPSRDIGWATAWATWDDTTAEDVILMQRAIAIETNKQRLSDLQVAFWMHSLVVAATVIASLVYLLRSA